VSNSTLSSAKIARRTNKIRRKASTWCFEHEQLSIAAELPAEPNA